MRRSGADLGGRRDDGEPGGGPARPWGADGRAAILEEYRRDPRRALTDEGVVCLVCGRLFRHLTNTHLRSHGLTAEQYKATFGYNVRRALMVTSLRTVHARNALRADLASWIRRRAIMED